MSTRTKVKPEIVRDCIARQDGGYLIVTRKGSGSSPTVMPIGASVVIRDGKAERAQ